MGATATKIVGPRATTRGWEAIYTIALDNNFLVTGESVDLSADFSYITSATICGCDAIADCAYVYNVVIPSAGTAITSDNVLIAAAQNPARSGDSASATALAICDTTDLSSVGELGLWVIGKRAA